MGGSLYSNISLTASRESRRRPRACPTPPGPIPNPENPGSDTDTNVMRSPGGWGAAVGYGGVDWPELSLPQQATEPSSLNPHM